MWDFIDGVVYINLDKRTDRYMHMQSIIRTFMGKAERFSAIEHGVGLVGCVKSHIEVLKMAISKKWKNVLIMEDDACWNEFYTGYSKLEALAKNPYDVIMLGGTFVERDENHKLTQAYTTVGYLVKDHYFKTLLDNFEEGLSLFLKDTSDKTFALDVWWGKLQRKDNWHLISPCLLYQKVGYSDIDHQIADSRWLYGLTPN
jgi:glycosyl transferase family 25